ncbi:hypothetical protein T06_11704 [Trichinella sp. T6]|nr:hypothetical protein T06_11704 [Trichinella sp. T6]
MSTVEQQLCSTVVNSYMLEKSPRGNDELKYDLSFSFHFPPNSGQVTNLNFPPARGGLFFTAESNSVVVGCRFGGGDLRGEKGKEVAVEFKNTLFT